MPRFIGALLLTTSLLVCSITAAPAPEPWRAYWEKPVDPLGDCRFDKDWDKLTITVPGIDHVWDKKTSTAPCLLREVEGDFVVQVRVGGNFKTDFEAEDDHQRREKAESRCPLGVNRSRKVSTLV